MNRIVLLIALLLSFSATAQFIPVDTAIVVTVGPLIDNGDFKTLETAIAYNATGMSVDLIESSGTASTKTDLTLTTASTQDWTHLGNGIYEIEITAAQNDTEGNLQVVGVVDGVLPFFSPVYTVVPVLVFNSLNLGSDNLQVDTTQIEGSDATNQINSEADTALADYDAPTNAEMVARTLVAASYFDPAADTVANVTTVATLSGHTPQTADHTASIAAILADTAAVDTTSELQTLLMGSAVAPASSTALATHDGKLDTVDSIVDAIVADTAAVDTTSEMRTFLTGADTPVAKESSIATAQSDLDILTGTDGVTLATSQPNYAPATAAALSTHDGKLDTVDNFLDTEIAAILEDTGTTLPSTLSTLATAAALDTVDNFLDTEIAAIVADTDELQTRFGLMIEADGGDWRFDTNSLEQAPGGSGGDATAANQTTIIAHLTDIKGATWSSSTDTLEAIANAIAGLDVGGGNGDTSVNHNFGSTDALRIVDGSGNGIVDATIIAYVASAFTSNPLTATVQATATTAADGRWETPMMLDSGTTYTLYIYKQGVYGPATTNVTP